MSGMEAMADATVAAQKEREKAKRRAIRNGKIRTVISATLTSIFAMVVIIAFGVLIQARIDASHYEASYLCNNCDTHTSSWTNYCRHCGDAFDKSDYVRKEDVCGDCNKEVYYYDTYCRYCGGKNIIKGEYVTIESIGNSLVEYIVIRK